MDELINAIYNYGIGVICIAYFMYFNSTTLKSITNTMSEVKQTLVLLNEKIEKGRSGRQSLLVFPPKVSIQSALQVVHPQDNATKK